MRSKNVRLVIFVGSCLILLGVVFFKSNVVGDKFAQANALMSRLQSSALYTDTLTDSELALLKTTREESQARITLLTTTITSDTTRAKGMIAEIALQTAILDNFTLKAPRSYFINNVDNKLGVLSTNTDLKALLDSINKQVNDRNIRESFIAWYDEFFATVCSTTDPTNDITVKGTVTFQNGSPASTDTCQGAVLVQTQCVNKQNIGTTQTTCPNGCNDGVCLNAPINTLKGFSITAAETVLINTSTNISISAIKNDNSVDTTYNKQVIILVDGDPNATFPLTAQTLVNGTLSIDNALKFKKVGNVTVTVKDLETGTESSKNIIVTENVVSTTSTSNTTTTGTGTTETTNTTTGGATTGTGTTTGSVASTSTTSTTGTTTASTTSGSTNTTTTSGTGSSTVGTTTTGTGSSTGTTTGGTGEQTQITCPQLSPPPADFCKDGTVIDGGKNTNGCQLSPICEPKLITGSVTIDGLKDCWFGDIAKKITLGDFMNYQTNTSTNSGVMFLDEIYLFGSNPPSIGEQTTGILGYEETNWTSTQNATPSSSTQLTNFFFFRSNSPETRTFTIPNSVRFYGCFARGDKPTVW